MGAVKDRVKQGISNQGQDGPAGLPQTLVGMSSGSIAKLLNDFKPAFAQALPRHLDPDRVLRIFSTVIRTNQDLLECTTLSLLGGLMTSAQLGLDLTPQLGEAYLVPFRNKNLGGQKEAQFIPGYKGLIKLARNSGEVSTVYAYIVDEADHFEVEYGLKPTIVHRRAKERTGKTVHYYSIVLYKDGGFNMFDMSLSEAMAEFKKHGNKNSKMDFDDWALKTCIRRMAKFMPRQTELATAAAVDGSVVDFPQGAHDLSADILPSLARVTESEEIDTETGEVGQSELFDSGSVKQPE